MSDKIKPNVREIPVVRSVLIEDLGSDIYRIESEGEEGEGPRAEFAATKVTLATKLGELFGLAGELAAVTAPKAKRGRKPRAPQPVLAAVPEAEAPKRRGVTVVKDYGEEAGK